MEKQIKEIEAMINPARPKRGEKYFDGVFCVNTIYMESALRKVIKSNWKTYKTGLAANAAILGWIWATGGQWGATKLRI